MPTKNQKGQGSIEILILSFTLVLIIKGLLTLFWIHTHFLWIEHQLYQGLICRAEKRIPTVCHNQVLTNIKKLTKMGRIHFLKMNHLNRKWRGSIQWEFYKWTFSIKNQLDLNY